MLAKLSKHNLCDSRFNVISIVNGKQLIFGRLVIQA